jgi:hypothetical protein
VEATTTEEVSAEPSKNEEVSDEVSTDDANGDASTAE